MTAEQQAAFVMAQAACAMAEIAGMQAANQQLIQYGEPLRYKEDDFSGVILRNGIGHNDVLGMFRS